MKNRLFIGVYPCGIRYADRETEVNNDYKPLAFLSFKTLVLDFEPDCPADLRIKIEADAAKIQAKRGQQYQISATGQYVILGQ